MRLYCESTRRSPTVAHTDETLRVELLTALQTADPNGSWIDDCSEADGLDPLTLEEAQLAHAEFFSRA